MLVTDTARGYERFVKARAVLCITRKAAPRRSFEVWRRECCPVNETVTSVASEALGLEIRLKRRALRRQGQVGSRWLLSLMAASFRRLSAKRAASTSMQVEIASNVARAA